MAIDPRTIINSPFGLNLAYLIGKGTPERLGQRIAMFIADRIAARRNWKMVRAARANQWVVSGERLDKVALDKVVAQNFRTIAGSIYDMYHNLNNPAAFIQLIDPHPKAIELVQRPEFCDRGLMVVGVHMSNFDMIFQIGGLAGIKALALTLPELNPAYQKQLEMRTKRGLKIIQASVGSIKQAVDHLKAGGMVITGIDRPDDSYIYRPRFFNRPAALPIHHIFLALKAHVPILVIAIHKKSDGKYHFLFSEPIEMQPHSDKHTEIMLNAEKILQVAEDYICHDPCQWAMTFPVWPDALDQVP
ncbi:MAG: lysophospholipid acyltransferase family protein [Acidobacteriaceae bacterium]